VYISQLIRYARACSTYDQFLARGSLLTNKLMSQGFSKKGSWATPGVRESELLVSMEILQECGKQSS
jgi:hypothetical protein